MDPGLIEIGCLVGGAVLSGLGWLFKSWIDQLRSDLNELQRHDRERALQINSLEGSVRTLSTLLTRIEDLLSRTSRISFVDESEIRSREEEIRARNFAGEHERKEKR